jgi:hypothetical protein
MSSQILGFIFLFLLCLALGLIFLLFRQIQNQKPKSRRVAVKPLRDKPSQSSVSHDLKKRLLRLLGGDQNTAARLISNLKQNYPNNPESWYWEKAILDLERDRH